MFLAQSDAIMCDDDDDDEEEEEDEDEDDWMIG
jgi:hypothetical protein